jgi:CRISP-associated protein Cas1
MKSAYAGLSRLDENPPENIPEFRALERPTARLILRTSVGVPIKWRGTSRRRISSNWHFIGQWSSSFHLVGNRNAAHPGNAIMNYAYAALESEIPIRPFPTATTPQLELCTKAATDRRNSFPI